MIPALVLLLVSGFIANRLHYGKPDSAAIIRPGETITFDGERGIHIVPEDPVRTDWGTR